jgi:hypothetical protein
MTSAAIVNKVWNFCHTTPSPKRYGASVTCVMMVWATATS